MGRMEAEQSEQGRGKKKKKKKKQKAGRLLQQQGRKSGQFLSLNESLLQENTQLYREATDLAVSNRKLNKRAGSMEADLHMEQKKNARLENELSAVKRTLVDVQAASVEKQQQQARLAEQQLQLESAKLEAALRKECYESARADADRRLAEQRVFDVQRRHLLAGAAVAVVDTKDAASLVVQEGVDGQAAILVDLSH